MNQTLRQRIRSQRRSLTIDEQTESAALIAVHCLAVFKQHRATRLSAYWPSDGEISPLTIVSAALKLGYTCTLPIIRSDRALSFAPLEPTTQYLSNRYQIPEPLVPPEKHIPAIEHDVILLPLTAFSRSGQRLGMGGGYYDRTLASCTKAPQRPRFIGLAHAFQEGDFETRAWDINLDYVITPFEVIEVSQTA